jgi:hypothetical protein
VTIYRSKAPTIPAFPVSKSSMRSRMNSADMVPNHAEGRSP